MVRLGLMQGHWRAVLMFWLAATAGSGALAATPPGFTPVALQKHDAGTFYIDGAITGYGAVRMLVDTGSSYLVISEAILGDLKTSGNARYSRDLEGVMADGTSRVIPLYRIAALRLGESCWVRDVEAAVFPGRTRPILGMNILAKLAPFTFSAEPPELGLQQCGAPQEKIEVPQTPPEAGSEDGPATVGLGQ
jgi:clan AA aspartic protease (TIGR02281 family)